jgi:transcriptional regulator with XRE-family HTH domain
MLRHVGTLSDEELREMLRPPFAKALRRMRRQRRLTQEELGDRAGVDRTFASMMERAQRTPSLTTLARLAEALSVTLQELIGVFEEEVDLARGLAPKDPSAARSGNAP